MQKAANDGRYGRRQSARRAADLKPLQFPYNIVVIAASEGGTQALIALLSQLPATFPVPIAIVQHRGITHKSVLAQILERHCKLIVKDAAEHQQIAPGVVYVAPVDRHLVVNGNRTFGFFDGTKICHTTLADPLFASAAQAFGSRVVAITLTGSDAEGTAGMTVIKQLGGLVIAQDETTSQQFAMPRSAVRAGSADFVLPIELIGPILQQIVQPRMLRVRSSSRRAMQPES